MSLSSALTLQPGRGSAWANLAMVYAKSGKVEESTAALIVTYRFSKDRAKTGSS
jgi:cytochrome c-type biogenesis protein CcmH/NrfG